MVPDQCSVRGHQRCDCIVPCSPRSGFARAASRLAAETAGQVPWRADAPQEAQRYHVDDGPIVGIHSAAAAIRAGNVDPAVAWCQLRSSRLRRVAPGLLLELRVAEFLELVRAGRREAAIAHAADHLARPAVAAYAEPETRDPGPSTVARTRTAPPDASSVLRRLQQLMGVLAFRDPAACGVPAVEALFHESRKLELAREFERGASRAVGLLPASPLRCALLAGACALKSPFDAEPGAAMAGRPSVQGTRRRWVEKTLLPAAAARAAAVRSRRDGRSPGEQTAAVSTPGGNSEPSGRPDHQEEDAAAMAAATAMHRAPRDPSAIAALDAETSAGVMSAVEGHGGSGSGWLWAVRADAPSSRREASKLLCALTALPLGGSQQQHRDTRPDAGAASAAAAPASVSHGAAVVQGLSPGTARQASRPKASPVAACSFPRAEGGSAAAPSAAATVVGGSTASGWPGRPVVLPCGRVVGDAALLMAEVGRRRQALGAALLEEEAARARGGGQASSSGASAVVGGGSSSAGAVLAARSELRAVRHSVAMPEAADALASLRCVRCPFTGETLTPDQLRRVFL